MISPLNKALFERETVYDAGVTVDIVSVDMNPHKVGQVEAKSWIKNRYSKEKIAFPLS